MSRLGRSGLGLLPLLALLGACDVGVVGDPGTGPGPDGGNNIAACVNRAGTIGTAYQHSGGAGTHAGEGCVSSGCHLAAALGAGAPAFQAAGTVYKADGTTPNGGAVVRIVSGSTPLTAFADDAGNFRFEQAITYPAKTDTSACPDMTPMIGQITTGPGQGGNCNSAACHAAGAQGPIKFQ